MSEYLKIEKVYYFGFKDDLYYFIVRRIFLKFFFGGVFSFFYREGESGVKVFFMRLKRVFFLFFFGGVESLVFYFVMSVVKIMLEERCRFFGIILGFIRFLVGVEDVDFFIEDIDRVLGGG